MKTPTQKALHVLKDSAARGGPIAAGIYSPDAIPTVVAMHLVATGRARWQQVAPGTELLTERKAPGAAAVPATAAETPAVAKPAKPKAEA